MSKRRHKSRRDNTTENRRRQMQQQRQTQQQAQQPQYNGPFGINPAQLLSMFGNIDMNQINNMLQNINRDGIDFNNFNLGMLQNLMGNNGGRTDNVNSFNNINNDNNETVPEMLENDDFLTYQDEDSICTNSDNHEDDVQEHSIFPLEEDF